MTEYIDELISAPLFTGIKKADMKAMLGCLGSFEKSYHKGEYIFLEQDSVKCVGIMLSGTVDIIKEDIWGNKTIMLRIKEKQLFGETFACSDDPLASVTYCAASDCKILFLQFERIINSCTRSCVFHHRMIENMVKLIADKNKELLEKIGIVSKKNLREKIMGYLSQQAQNHGSNRFEIPLGRVELAEYLCADRSALTRELSNMKSDGIIDYHKNFFEILSSDFEL